MAHICFKKLHLFLSTGSTLGPRDSLQWTVGQTSRGAMNSLNNMEIFIYICFSEEIDLRISSFLKGSQNKVR